MPVQEAILSPLQVARTRNVRREPVAQPITRSSSDEALPATVQRLLEFVSSNRGLILRLALAVVFVWFGGLKIFGKSPAYGLVEQTVFWFPAETFVPILGWAEVLIGLGLAFGFKLRWVLVALAAHMAATFSPFVLIPEVCFQDFPFELTMEGQYICKNLVIIAAGMVIASDSLVRRARMQSGRNTPL